MDDSQTPRALIEQFIDSNAPELSAVPSHRLAGETPSLPTVRPRRSPRGQLASKRTLSGTQDQDQVTKKRGNISTTELDNTVTPRSTIEAFLQGTSQIEQTSRRNDSKQSRVTPGRKRTSLSSSYTGSSRKVDLRKKATLKHMSQSFNEGPTPRGMIQGFITGAEESTPAVRERTDTHLMNSTGLDDVLLTRRRQLQNSTLGESYYLPSSAPESGGRGDRVKRPSPRNRKQFNLDQFAKDTAARIEKMRDANESARVPEMTEELPQTDMPTPSHTGELEKLPSKNRTSLKGRGDTELSITPVTMVTQSPTTSSPANKSLSQRKTMEKTTLAPSVTQSPSQSGRRSVGESYTSPRRSTRLSGAYSSPGGVSSSQAAASTNEPDTVTRQANKARLKDQLVAGTIQEVVANIVPVGESLTKSVSDQTPDKTMAQFESSHTSRVLRSRSNVSSPGVNMDKSTASHYTSQNRSHTVTQNAIIEDKELQEDQIEEEVVASLNAAEDAEESDDEQIEPDVDSESEEEGSSDEDKENLPEEQMHRQSLASVGTDALRQKSVLPTDTQEVVPGTSGTQTKPPRKRAQRQKGEVKGLPLSLTRSIFSHFSQAKVSRDVMREVESVAEEYWKNVFDDLAAYAQHANRTTVQTSDVELLMKRQGFVTDKQSLFTLVRKWLPLEYRTQIIPCASSKNVVFPKEAARGRKSSS